MADNLNNFLKGLDPRSLAEGIKKAQEYAATPEGKKFINEMKSGNGPIKKDEVTDAFKNNPEILAKINELLK